jgi:uncharacterized protein with HEPN domain
VKKPDPLTFLQHILGSLELIQEYLLKVSEKKFKSTPAIQDQVLYRLLIIGEAVKNMPEEIRKQHTDIPWKAIAGLRDVLIHQYFGVDLDEVWAILKNRLPLLKKQIEKIVKSSQGSEGR